jgi:hypothetical protein
MISYGGSAGMRGGRRGARSRQLAAPVGNCSGGGQAAHEVGGASLSVPGGQAWGYAQPCNMPQIVAGVVVVCMLCSLAVR